MLKWPSGIYEGQPCEFTQWQMDDLISPVFGNIGPDGRRVTRQVLMLIGRGNGKTGVMEVIAWYMFLGDGEQMPHIDLFSYDSIEAGKIFDSMATVVYNDSTLREMLTVRESDMEIYCPANKGRVKVATGTPKKALGGRPHFILFDELLQQDSAKLFDNARTGLGKRGQPLMVSATTGSPESQSFAEDEVAMARLINDDRDLEPAYVPILYECSADADPNDREEWHKANPGLKDGLPLIETLESELRQALLKPSKMVTFKWARMNQFGSGMSTFIDEIAWANLAAEPDLEKMGKWWCYGGLDLSVTTDLTSVCWLFWDGDLSGGRYFAIWRHWTTSVMLSKLDQLTSGAFSKWVKHDSVSCGVTHGKAIDYEDVNQKVIADGLRFEPWQVGIDQWNAGHTMTKLSLAGVPWDNCKQGLGLTASIQKLDGLIEAGALNHNGDLVAAWAAKCVKVAYDRHGRPSIIRPNSKTTAERVDPIAALAMAVDRHLKHVRETPEEELPFMLVTAADVLDAMSDDDPDTPPIGDPGTEYEEEITRA